MQMIVILVLLKSPARQRFWGAGVSHGPHLLGRSRCQTISVAPWQIL